MEAVWTPAANQIRFVEIVSIVVLAAAVIVITVGADRQRAAA